MKSVWYDRNSRQHASWLMTLYVHGCEIFASVWRAATKCDKYFVKLTGEFVFTDNWSFHLNLRHIIMLDIEYKQDKISVILVEFENYFLQDIYSKYINDVGWWASLHYVHEHLFLYMNGFIALYLIHNYSPRQMPTQWVQCSLWRYCTAITDELCGQWCR